MNTIAYKNLPARPPVLLTAVTWLLLDRLDASGLWWGVAITLLALIWINQIVGMVREDHVDVIDEIKALRTARTAELIEKMRGAK